MTRISALRAALSMSQSAFGELIGLSQGRISQLEAGVRESRSITRMLDMVAAQRGLHHLVGAAFAPASPEIPASAGSDVPSRCNAALERPSLGVSSLTSLAASGSACGEGFSGVAE